MVWRVTCRSKRSAEARKKEKNQGVGQVTVSRRMLAGAGPLQPVAMASRRVRKKPSRGPLFFLTGNGMARRRHTPVFPYKYPLSLNVGDMLFLANFTPQNLS